MAKKKTAGRPNNGEEIIVLNQGQEINVEDLKKAEKELNGGANDMEEQVEVKVEDQEGTEEGFNILGEGSEDEGNDIVIDTSHLDEELSIGDVMKEAGVLTVPIGGGKKDQEVEEEQPKKDKKKNKEEKKDAKKQEFKQILEVFTMVLKGKDYEPIPYPFDGNEVIEEATFERCVESLDYMIVAKFIRKNPTLTLKDAFKYVFTVSEKQEEKIRKSENLVKVEEVKPLGVVDSELEKKKDIVKKCMGEMDSVMTEEINTVLMEVLAVGDDTPEKVAEMLMTASKKLQETSAGKFITKLTRLTIADIVRAAINGDKTVNDVMHKRLIEQIEAIEPKKDLLLEKVNDDTTVHDLFEIILSLTTPSIEGLSISQIMKSRKELVPDMNDEEFLDWIIKIRETRDLGNIQSKAEVKEVTPLDTALERVTESGKRFSNVMNGGLALVGRVF